MITFPFELRSRLAYDSKLLAAVGRIVDDSVLGFYRRPMRDHHGIVGKSGAVTVVQRASSDLRLNPHFHAIVWDGVFAPDGAR
ncbi:transposase [Myxococcota bacterium]